MHRLEQPRPPARPVRAPGSRSPCRRCSGPVVAVADPLEVLRGRHRRPRRRRRRARRPRPPRPRAAPPRRGRLRRGCLAEAGVELLLRPADEDALSRLRDRRPSTTHGVAATAQSSSGRHAGRLEHLLRRSLRPFDRAAALRRAEYGDSRPAERVDESDHQRRLGADDDEIDAELAATARAVLAVPPPGPGGTRRAPRCPGSQARSGATRATALRQLPGERVLASARPDDEHLHGARVYCAPAARASSA